MDHRGVFLGIICCLIAGVWTQSDDQTVKVGDDITVMPTPSNAAMKDRVNVTLTCTGSKAELSYYIHNSPAWSFTNNQGHERRLTKGFYPSADVDDLFNRVKYDLKYGEADNGYYFNLTIFRRCTPLKNVSLFQGSSRDRVAWSFVDVEGVETPLTSGFYSDEAADSKFKTDNARYKLEYGQSAAGFDFTMTITGVVDADNGVYKCSLLDKTAKPIHEESLKLTVARGVEKVSMELMDDKGKTLKTSHDMSASVAKVELLPGTYKVKCRATGSNPAAKLTLMMDENQPYVNPTMTKKVEDGREKHTTSLEQNIVVKASDLDQQLLCSANTENGLFKSKQASILMAVQTHTPHFACANVSAMEDDRYTKVQCNITIPNGGPPMCKNVRWVFGENDFTLTHSEKKKDLDGQYDIVESTCTSHGDHLDVVLNLYKMKKVFFNTIIFVVYGNGDSAHRYPIRLSEKVSGASSLSQVSLLAAVAMAVLSRVFVKHL